jgi:hypothetical protein
MQIKISMQTKCLSLLLLLVITFMQGICKYITETIHVSGVHSVAAIL